MLAGSSRMFGKYTIGNVTEETQFKRTGFYESYKIDAHKLLMKYKYKYAFKATTAIFFNHDSIYRNNYFIIPRLVNSLIHKKYSFLKRFTILISPAIFPMLKIYVMQFICLLNL